MLLLAFTVGPNRYAVNACRVIELVPKVNLCPIPHSPPALAGLLSYRGEAVPVIDLGVLLAVAPSRSLLSTRIILANDGAIGHNQTERMHDGSIRKFNLAKHKSENGQYCLGLVAEAACDLIYTSSERILPAPAHVSHAPYFQEIVQIDEGFIQLIAVEKIRAAAIPEVLVDQQNSEPASWSGEFSKSEPMRTDGGVDSRKQTNG